MKWKRKEIFVNSDIIIIALTFIAMLVVCGVDASRKRRDYLDHDYSNHKEING